MAGATLSKKTLEIRCRRGRRGSARSPRTPAASPGSASARVSTCPSELAPSPLGCLHPHSTSEIRDLVPPLAAQRSTRRSSSCRRSSCGWPSCSCCGSSSHDRRKRPRSSWAACCSLTDLLPSLRHAVLRYVYTLQAALRTKFSPLPFKIVLRNSVDRFHPDKVRCRKFGSIVRDLGCMYMSHLRCRVLKVSHTMLFFIFY